MAYYSFIITEDNHQRFQQNIDDVIDAHPSWSKIDDFLDGPEEEEDEYHVYRCDTDFYLIMYRQFESSVWNFMATEMYDDATKVARRFVPRLRHGSSYTFPQIGSNAACAGFSTHAQNPHGTNEDDYPTPITGDSNWFSSAIMLEHWPVQTADDNAIRQLLFITGKYLIVMVQYETTDTRTGLYIGMFDSLTVPDTPTHEYPLCIRDFLSTPRGTNGKGVTSRHPNFQYKNTPDNHQNFNMPDSMSTTTRWYGNANHWGLQLFHADVDPYQKHRPLVGHVVLGNIGTGTALGSQPALQHYGGMRGLYYDMAFVRSNTTTPSFGDEITVNGKRYVVYQSGLANNGVLLIARDTDL